VGAKFGGVGARSVKSAGVVFGDGGGGAWRLPGLVVGGVGGSRCYAQFGGVGWYSQVVQFQGFHVGRVGQCWFSGVGI
jgi:hypothetical protein